MQAETQAHIDTISSALDLLRTHVDFDAASARLVELEALSAEGDFWNDQATAQNAMREKNKLQRQVDMITSLQTELNDAVELIELGEMEGDTDVVSEAEAAIAALVPMAENGSLKACCQARQMAMTAFWKCMPAPAEPRRRTGHPCWCVCVAVGANGAVSSCR